ncbi:hypothetical protein HK096_010927, partial [Nowakowskiella sp. JEL0078]
ELLPTPVFPIPEILFHTSTRRLFTQSQTLFQILHNALASPLILTYPQENLPLLLKQHLLRTRTSTAINLENFSHILVTVDSLLSSTSEIPTLSLLLQLRVVLLKHMGSSAFMAVLLDGEVELDGPVESVFLGAKETSNLAVGVSVMFGWDSVVDNVNKHETWLCCVECGADTDAGFISNAAGVVSE